MTPSHRAVAVFFAGGLALTILGAFLGLLLGAAIGGSLTSIIDIPVVYAGLPGYEGAGALGLVLGPSIALLGWILSRLKGRLRRDALIILAVTTVIEVVAQDALWTKPGWIALLFLPIVSQTLLLGLHRRDTL